MVVARLACLTAAKMTMTWDRFKIKKKKKFENWVPGKKESGKVKATPTECLLVYKNMIASTLCPRCGKYV